jgi:hypothetical protein
MLIGDVFFSEESLKMKIHLILTYATINLFVLQEVGRNVIRKKT